MTSPGFDCSSTGWCWWSAGRACRSTVDKGRIAMPPGQDVLVFDHTLAPLRAWIARRALRDVVWSADRVLAVLSEFGFTESARDPDQRVTYAELMAAGFPGDVRAGAPGAALPSSAVPDDDRDSFDDPFAPPTPHFGRGFATADDESTDHESAEYEPVEQDSPPWSWRSTTTIGAIQPSKTWYRPEPPPNTRTACSHRQARLDGRRLRGRPDVAGCWPSSWPGCGSVWRCWSVSC
ncbi:hypothetical protein GCM10027167_71070 [Nocardia heshunensis]